MSLTLSINASLFPLRACQVEVELGGLENDADTAVTERRAAVPWLTADGVGDDPYGACRIDDLICC